MRVWRPGAEARWSGGHSPWWVVSEFLAGPPKAEQSAKPSDCFTGSTLCSGSRVQFSARIRLLCPGHCLAPSLCVPTFISCAAEKEMRPALLALLPCARHSDPLDSGTMSSELQLTLFRKRPERSKAENVRQRSEIGDRAPGSTVVTY